MFDKKSDAQDDFLPEISSNDDFESEIEAIESNEADKIKSLKMRLKETEKQKAAYLEDVQRVKADFLNSKRRLEEQLNNDKLRLVDNFLVDMLPLLDSFELALAEVEDAEDSNANWKTGIRAIHAQLLSLLKIYNISEIASEGEVFDPHMHEAVSKVTIEDGAQADTIVSVLQKGYQRDGRVLRPARVTVGVEK